MMRARRRRRKVEPQKNVDLTGTSLLMRAPRESREYLFSHIEGSSQDVGANSKSCNVLYGTVPTD